MVEQHGPRLQTLLVRILIDPHAAHDAAQETWLAIWNALDRLRADSDPWPFIRTTGVRKAIDLKRVRVLQSSAELDQRSAPRPPPPLELVGLAAEERACLTLYFVEGCSVREIADQLGVPTGTVKSWMSRARERLRQRWMTEHET